MDNGIQDMVVPTIMVEVVDVVIQMIVVHLKKGEISLTGESRMSNATIAENMGTMPQNVCTRKLTMSTLLKHQAVRTLLSYWQTMILVVNMMFGTLTLVQEIICVEENKLLLNLDLLLEKKTYADTIIGSNDYTSGRTTTTSFFIGATPHDHHENW
jgi:hypothetical protein